MAAWSDNPWAVAAVAAFASSLIAMGRRAGACSLSGGQHCSRHTWGYAWSGALLAGAGGLGVGLLMASRLPATDVVGTVLLGGLMFDLSTADGLRTFVGTYRRHLGRVLAADWSKQPEPESEPPQSDSSSSR